MEPSAPDTKTGALHPGRVMRGAAAFAAVLATSAFASVEPVAPKTIPELRQRIEIILSSTGTPAAGVAIVGRDGPVWVDAVGLADAAENRAATEDTLFPIGSIAKSFVALSLLKLQEEGRLSLQDTLKSRAPDVEFGNPWESTDPVRIVHLLEHTSGWDDTTPREGNWIPPAGTSRREAIAHFPRSLTSRWRPGTCFSYSNLGPDVAAYVIERVAGERFEDYVARTWFAPLGMSDATYCEQPGTVPNLATCYGPDGGVVHTHFNVLTRPAGSVAASARDMANLVEFFLNRGSFRGRQFLPGTAIERMERPTSTYAAAEGLTIGYGLGNQTSEWGGWVFHGHGGAVPGALAEMDYLPEEGVGYAFMINREDGGARWQIEQLIRSYLTRNLKPPQAPRAAAVDEAQLAAYSGWYEPFTPRDEGSRYLERILGVTQVSSGEGQLFLDDLTNGKHAFVRVAGGLYRRTDNSRSLVLIRDQSDGTYFQSIGGPTFRRMPPVLAALKLGFAAVTALLMLSSVLLAFAWVPRNLTKGAEKERFLGVRSDPLLATISGAAVSALVWESSNNYFARANGAAWSGGWIGATNHVAGGAFVFFSIRGLYRALLRRESGIARPIWWHSLATSFVLAAWAIYMAYGGLRGDFS